jgi:hypothetical protein
MSTDTLTSNASQRSERSPGRLGERTFRTDGGPADNDRIFELDASGVRDLPVSIDYVKLTREGKLQIALVGEAVRGEELGKIRDLLLVMTGRLRVDFTPEQGELPL